MAFFVQRGSHILSAPKGTKEEEAWGFWLLYFFTLNLFEGRKHTILHNA